MTYRQGRNLPPVDLSGCTAVLFLADRLGGAEVELNAANGGVVTGGVTGSIEVNLGHALYVALPPGDYAYRLGVNFTSGVRFLARGKWTIR